MLESARQTRGRKRIVQQFQDQGFTEIPAPKVAEMLPLRYPELIREKSVCLFEKGDTQVLVFSTAYTPRTRLPHRPRLFMLVVMPIGQDASIRSTSAAIREPSEVYSVVDLLDLDSYPSISPLPDGTIFAADGLSARRIMDVLKQQKPLKSRGSLVLHAGRLLFQMPE
jgi:hypothetical protein